MKKQNIVRKLDTAIVNPDPNQPRKTLAGIDELAASIASEGQLQPITVKQDGDTFTIITGQRRWAACKAVGLPVEAIVVSGDQDWSTVQLMENLAREDLLPSEEIRALHRAISAGHDPDNLAYSIGRSPQYVRETVALAELGDEMLQAIDSKTLPKAVATELVALPEKAREKAFKKIVKTASNGGGVRQMKATITALTAKREGKKTGGNADRDAGKALDALMRAVKRYKGTDTTAAVVARTKKLSDIAELAKTLRQLASEIDDATALRAAVING